MVSAMVSATCIDSQAIRICEENWRRRPDLNRGWRFCRPLPYHLATAPIRLGGDPAVDNLRMACDRSSRSVDGRERRLERETGFEPATSTLARSHSTTELFPLAAKIQRTTPIF